MLPVAQESRALDRAGARAVGPVKGQAAGEEAGVGDTVGLAAGVCLGPRARGPEPACAVATMGAHGCGGVVQRIVGADAQGGREGETAPGRNPWTMEGRINQRVPGRTQPFVFRYPAQGARLSLHRVSNRDALLRRRQAGEPLLWRIPTPNVEEALSMTKMAQGRFLSVRHEAEASLFEKALPMEATCASHHRLFRPVGGTGSCLKTGRLCPPTRHWPHCHRAGDSASPA